MKVNTVDDPKVVAARQALFGADLSVAAGERVAILGPNGAGKTTLVLHLNGTLGGGSGGSGGTGAGSVVVDGLTVSATGGSGEIRR